MSGPKRLVQYNWLSALSMRLTWRATEGARSPRRRAYASANRASCVPVVLVGNIVDLETKDTWWRPLLGARGERV